MVMHVTCHSFSNFYTSAEMGRQVVEVLTSRGLDLVGSLCPLKIQIEVSIRLLAFAMNC